jgi:LPXTG-motif cell wall-anchored protein
VRRILCALATAVGVVLITVTPASAVAIRVTPSTVVVGGTVTISGDTLVNGKPGCLPGDDVILISTALNGHVAFVEGSVELKNDATGHFRGTATITSVVAPGTYTITARCGGGNMGGVQDTLTVIGLPRTGAETTPIFAVALGGLAAGSLAMGLGSGRRRRRC